MLPSIAGDCEHIKRLKAGLSASLSSTFSQTYEVGLNPHYRASLEGLRTELFDVAVCR